jgi:hypothetical protein
MIIKSMSRKEPSFDQLTAYMLAPEGAQIGVVHNLPAIARTPADIIAEFTDNHALLPRRANGNALYHEIIALEPNENVPKAQQIATLRKIAARYLDERAPRQLAVGVIHAETAHIHMHLMISANAVLSKKRVWLKKADFAEIQKSLEAYQLKHHPELGTAQHYAETREGLKRRTREQAASLRTGKASHKEELASTLEALLQKARSREALDTELANLGLSLYQRGRSVGVVTEGGRRYRLTTLGLGEAYTDAATRFDLTESRMASLQRRRSVRSPERDREI